ncbi:MAG: succinate--CoA ligase subunit alpha [Thermaerobacter sp.]|nr:succinate--CoA ligase subunit alpha [Thermaerobacter sp.]
MSILLHGGERVLVQGITGRQGSFHTRRMLEYGTAVVAGVSPGKGGASVEGVPVYDTVREAVANTGATCGVVFVPAPQAADAAMEALEHGIDRLVLVTEHVPVHDTARVLRRARAVGAQVVGPNTFGVITPGRGKLGIMPHEHYAPGPVGLVARSGTLSYEIAAALTAAGLGQSTALGVGGDPVVGQSLAGVLAAFEADEATRVVVLVGEIGGTAEEEAAPVVSRMTKPVVAFLAGRTAPPGRRMGHAGAIVEGDRGTWASKAAALREAGAAVAELPWEVAALVRRRLGR